MSNRSTGLPLEFSAKTAALALIASLAVGCPSPKPNGAPCGTNGDCPKGQNCLFDLTRSASYCALTCTSSDTACRDRCATDENARSSYCSAHCTKDSDCPPQQFCDDGTDVATSSAAEMRLCVDRVRVCQKTELCNGLDDNCDGVIDGPSCTPIGSCLDDAPCGAFVCVASDQQASATCAPRNMAASVADFAACTDPSQCANGLCETGTCSPLCRFDAPDCPSDLLCTRAVGPSTRPPHNACQLPCKTDADCAAITGQSCVFRDVYQGGDLHAFVCSFPGPDRKKNGSACSGNDPMGDDECAFGLCYGHVCTRSCSGPADACADVGNGFTCASQVQLIYGVLQVTAQICVAP
jgi:hypothetical protein